MQVLIHQLGASITIKKAAIPEEEGETNERRERKKRSSRFPVNKSICAENLAHTKYHIFNAGGKLKKKQRAKQKHSKTNINRDRLRMMFNNLFRLR